MKLSCAAIGYKKQLTGQDPGNALTMQGFIDMCAGMGCDGVELTSYYFPDPPTDELYSLKRTALVNGLDITGMPIRTNLCQPPGEESDRQVAQIGFWLERAAYLGSPCIRVFAGGREDGDRILERRWFIDNIRRCLPDAEKRGVALALENHGGITPTGEDLVRLARDVGSPYFGINLDTGNFWTPDPYADTAAAAGDAMVVHIKTDIYRDGKTEDANLARKIGILHEAGYRGYVVLEYEGQAAAVEAIPRHLAELRMLIDEVNA